MIPPVSTSSTRRSWRLRTCKTSPRCKSGARGPRHCAARRRLPRRSGDAWLALERAETGDIHAGGTVSATVFTAANPGIPAAASWENRSSTSCAGLSASADRVAPAELTRDESRRHAMTIPDLLDISGSPARDGKKDSALSRRLPRPSSRGVRHPAALTAEEERLQECGRREAHWKRWGPYVSERAWGTVREDYSAAGEAWNYLPHDHARSRAYRWNEDGLAGISDRHQSLAFALALWNERDPIPQGAAVRTHRPRGQPRRRRQGVLLLPRQHAYSLLHEVSLQVPAGRVPVRGAGRPRTVGEAAPNRSSS